MSVYQQNDLYLRSDSRQEVFFKSYRPVQDGNRFDGTGSLTKPAGVPACCDKGRHETCQLCDSVTVVYC